MTTRGRDIFARFFKKEAVRRAFAAALLAAPLAAAPARAADWYPGNGAAMSAPSAELYLPSPEVLAQCGLYRTVKKTGGAQYSDIQTAVNSLPVTLSTNSCVVIIDTDTYGEQVSVSGFNTGGWRLTLMKEPGLSASPTINPAGAFPGFYSDVSSVTLRGVNVAQTFGGAHAVSLYGHFAEVLQSTITVSDGTYYGLSLNGASSATISQVYVSNPSGDAVGFNNNANSNRLSQSSFVAFTTGKAAVYFGFSSSNTITGSYLFSQMGYGVRFSNGLCQDNTVALSTIVAVSGTAMPAYFDVGSGNSVTDSYLWSNAGIAARFDSRGMISSSTVISEGNAAVYLSATGSTVTYSVVRSGSNRAVNLSGTGNVVSFSTLTANSSSDYGAYFTSGNNLLSDSFVYNKSGTAVYIMGSASGTSIRRSTATSEAPGYYGLYTMGAPDLSIKHSFFLNPYGAAMYFSGGDRTSVSFSTVAGGPGFPALSVNGATSFELAGSFVQGSTAAYFSVANASVTHSVLVSTVPGGDALWMTGAGSFSYSVSSSTLSGGPGGAAFRGTQTGGSLRFSSNTIAGGSLGVSMPQLSVSVSSLTFQSLQAGATAMIMPAGGPYVVNISSVAFDSPNIAVNIDASAMGAGSAVNVYYPSGVSASQWISSDPYHYIQWPWPSAQSLMGVNSNTIGVGIGTNGAKGYEVIASTTFNLNSGPYLSSATAQQLSQLTLTGLLYNTTHYILTGALWDRTTYYYPSNMASVTQMQDPTTVVLDEVGVTTIVASAYAPGPAFTNLQLGQSGVAVSTDGAYLAWGVTRDNWTGKTSMSVGRQDLAVAALGGKLYAVGGYNGAWLNTNEEYDPVLNLWVTKTSMPTARRELGAAVIGRKLYAVGGNINTSIYSVNEEYDPETNSWTTKAPMLTPRRYVAAAAVGNKLYAVGGYDGSISNANEEYDPSVNAWAAKAVMPTARRSAALAVIGGKLYVIGGHNGAVLDTNEEYDPAANTWATRAVMPTARSGHAAAAIGGRLYAVGGYVASWLDTNEEYDPASNAWVTKAVMPSPRTAIAAAALGGKLYAVGGYYPTYSTVNEEYTPGVASVLSGLRPNTQYVFHAKSRNQAGLVGAESQPGISTYTLAAVAPSTGATFTELDVNSVKLWWSSGTAAGGYNGPGATYRIEYSSSASFTPTDWTQPAPDSISALLTGLRANTTYYFRIQAYNSGGMTDASWLSLGSTVTLIEQPTSVYIDVVSTKTIIASAYAPGAAFSGLERGVSAVSIAKDGVYDIWGSTGNYWMTMAPMPTNRWVLAAAAVGGKVYAIGGSNGSYQTKNEEYDPATNTWATKTDMPTARNVSCAAVVGNRIYALHGDNISGNLAVNEEYDPSANTWRTMASAPVARRYAACGAINGKIYVVGGRGATQTDALADNYEYNPSSNVWTARAPLPTARYGMAAGVIGGKLYAAAGWNGAADLAVNEEYDPATDTWSTKTAPPTTRRYVVSEVLGGKLYVVGGNKPASYLDITESYDPAVNTWETRAAMPSPRGELASAMAGGRLYALGGSDSTPIATNEVYNPGTARKFSGLTPNTQYTFKARARSQNGTATGDSALVSTWTLAAVGLPASGRVFGAVYSSSAAVNWSSGTGTAFNGAGAGYLVTASTSPDYLGGNNVSSFTYNVDGATLPLAANTTYYFRVQAYNAGHMTDYSWLALGSTVTMVNPPTYMSALNFSSATITLRWGTNGNGPDTWYTAQVSTDSNYNPVAVSSVTLASTATLAGLLPNTYYYTRVRAVNQTGSPTAWLSLSSLSTKIEPAESVYFDEVGVATITASAYARGAAFSNLHIGVSAVAVSSGDAYDLWGSSGGYWDVRPQLPTGRYYLSAAAVGGKIHVLGGYNGSYYDLNEEYDPAAGVWTTKTPMPEQRANFGAAVLGGKVYAVGGNNGLGFVIPTAVYDPVVNAWASKAGLPQSRKQLSVTAAAGRIYALGGYNATLANSNYAYDVEADTWAAKAPLPAALNLAAAAEAFGKIYLLGGNSGSVSAGNYEYDPAGDSWTTKTPLNSARGYHAAAAVGGKIYIFGGFNGGSLKSASVYDPGADTWSALPAMSVARDSLSAAAVAGNIYVLGGSNAGARQENEAYHTGVSRRFTGLLPNTRYDFKAQARDQYGTVTPETAVVSTYTLAYVGMPKSGVPFVSVLHDQVSVAWSSGTDTLGYNGPGAGFLVHASTTSDFSGAIVSSYTYNSVGVMMYGLSANNTYYFRVQAYNAGGMTDYKWLLLGSTVTRIETPTSVYIDEVGSTTIVASAYAAWPAFTGLDRPGAAVAVTTTGVYDVWNSSGGYWVGLAPLLADRVYTSGAVLAGRIHVVGGGDGGSSYYDYHDAYDPAANQWTTLAPLPTARRVYAAGAIGQKLYAVGGYNGSGHLGVNEAYDAASNSWATKAAMPTPRSSNAAAVVGGKLYVLGGDSGSISDKNEMYDPESDGWTSKASLPFGRYNVSAGVAGGKIYVVGGADAGGLTGVNHEYDPVADSWSTRAAMPTVRHWPGVAGLGGKIYAAGGMDSGGLSAAANEEYDPAGDAWVTRAPMLTPRRLMAAVALQGRFYAIAGFAPGTVNEAYVPGVARVVTGLKPNTQYYFKAKARGQDGTLTGESAEVSTYTLATVALMPDGHAFDGVYASSVIVAWASGTAAGGYNGPNAFYELQGSTAPDFTGALSINNGWNPVSVEGLLANTTYHFRIKAWNVGNYTDGRWLALGSTVTRIETPESVYFDEVTSNTVVASAYAPGAAFTGLERGRSGVNISLDGGYDTWGSSGNYWTARLPMPSARGSLAAAALGGRLYAVGGTNGQTDNTEYDPVSNSWTSKAAMPTGRYYLAAAALGGRLYAVGGSGGPTANEEYDPVSGAWTTRAPMPTGRMELAVASVRGRLYAAGGNQSGTLLKVVEAYDPATDTWSTKTPMNGERAIFALAAIDDRLYAAGGMTGPGSYTAAAEAYDPGSDTWSSRASLPAQYGGMAYGVIGGKLYVSGGYDGSYLAVTAQYDPAADAWAGRAPAPTARSEAAAAAIGGALYVVGGSNGSLTNYNEKYQPGVSAVFQGLGPNTQHSFKARARGQDGAVTGESVELSTWTLAATPAATDPAFVGVTTGALQVNWHVNNNPGYTTYYAQLSALQDFSAVAASSLTKNAFMVFENLGANTTYYARVAALNNANVPTEWLTVGSTVTLVNPPVGLPSLAVTTWTITAAWGANGNPGDTWYNAEAAADPGFVNVLASSRTTGLSALLAGLPMPNSYYFLHVNAVNRAGSPTNWVNLPSTPTAIELPVAVYFDEVDSMTVTALAYAPTPGFSALAAGGGINITTGAAYGAWNGTGDVWASRTGMPGPRDNLAAAAIGGRLYAVGGEDSGGSSPKNEMYDPVLNGWVTKAQMPSARRNLFAAVIDGKLYAVGGYATTGVVGTNEVYDPEADAWTTLAAMPTARQLAAGGAAGGKLYVAGGYITDFTAVNEEYDPAADKWVTKTPLPAARSDGAGAAVNGTIYVVGGNYSGGLTGLTEAYDPATDTWSTKATMLKPRQYPALAVSGGKMYVAGGNPGAGFTDLTEEYDPAADKWTERAPMSAVRRSFAAASVRGRIYFVGGWDGTFLNRNEMYDTGAARVFSGLVPNTLYQFKAKARNAAGAETPETVQFSTWTLAVPPDPKDPAGVFVSSIALTWANGSNPPGTTLYRAQVSTSPQFAPVAAASDTYNTSALFGGLLANTTYYSRVAAINGAGSMTAYASLGSTATRVETPTALVFDDVSTNSITASAYAQSPSFTGLARGLSGVNITTEAAYGVWGSTGDAWNVRAALPTARFAPASAVVGGRLYVIGGSGGADNVNEEYDPAANVWVTKAVMPTPRYYLAAAAVGSKIYAVGGRMGPWYALNEEYDAEANTWSTKTPMPAPRSSLAAAAVGGKVYALGGYNGTTTVDLNEEYDPARDAWTTKNHMSGARNTLAAAAAGGKIYVLGGYYGVRLNLNQSYDPATDTWTTKTQMPTARDTLAAAALGGKVYALGGSSGAAGLDLNEEYDPASDAWITRAPMPGGNSAFAAAALGGKIYAMGGDNAGPLNANWEYRPGSSRYFTGLAPNTQYTFKAKLRNQAGAETPQVTASTWTLAAMPGVMLPAFSAVSVTGLSALWQPTNPAGTFYDAQLSTSPDFRPVAATSVTVYNFATFGGLAGNTSYYARVAAVNGGGVYTDFLLLGSTATRIEAPTAVYIDEVTTYSVTASAYAPGAAFTGLDRGVSGVNIALENAYGVWGSTGNYWTAKAAMPTGRYHAAAAAVGGKLYAVGGYGATYLAVNEEYDPAVNAWVTKTPMPTARNDSAAGAIGGRLYVVGGANGADLTVNEEYDPAANAWVTKRPMPTPRSYAAAGVIKGVLYVAGGGGTGYKTEAYDPASDSWTGKADLPTARGMLAGAVSGGKLYAVGGSGPSSKNEVYDPDTDTWSTKADLPTPRYGLAAGSVGGKIYAVSGYGASYSRANEEYDPSADTWTARADMPDATVYLPAVGLGGRLYLVGGSAVPDRNLAFTPGVSRVFSGLQPNKAYSFKAMARNLQGIETGESATVSTYTLAVVALPAGGDPFAQVWSSSVTVVYSSGSAAGGWNGPGATYQVEASTAADFTGGRYIGAMFNPDDLFREVTDLPSNTTFYFRAMVYNAGWMTDYSWVPMGSTVTRAIVPNAATTTFSAVAYDGLTVHWGANNNADGTSYRLQLSTGSNFEEPLTALYPVTVTTQPVGSLLSNTTYYARVAAVSYSGAQTPYYVIGAAATAMQNPAGVYFDEVGTTTIVASGYAPAFTGLDRGFSGVNVTTGAPGAYGAWASGGDAWTSRNAMPIGRYRAAAAALGGKLYIFGGDNGGPLGDVWEHDPAAGSWTSKSAMLTTRWAAAAAALGGKIFVVGGSNGPALNTVEEYDPAADAWTSRPAMNTQREAPAAAAINGKLYVAGGYNGVYLNEVEEFDPAGALWTTKTSMLASRMAPAYGVVNGKLYVIGGISGITLRQTVEEYDPATDTWAIKADLPAARAYAASAAVGGKIYAIGGQDAGAGWLTRNEVYDPASDTWADAAPMSVVRRYASGAAIGGRIFVAGGLNGTGYQNALEEYNPGVTRSFAGLLPNTAYTFYARARNQDGLETNETLPVSTRTLAAASAPQQGPLFSEVWTASMTVHWSSGTAAGGFNAPGASYLAGISDSPDFASGSGAGTSDLYHNFGGLSPNTTYYARVRARNSDGALDYRWQVLGATPTLAGTISGAGYTAVYPTSVTVSWSAMPFGLSEGFRVEASTAPDFSGVVHSSASAVFSAESLTVQNLLASATYYLRAGSLNWNGAANYAQAGSTCTPKENTPPTIGNNELTTDYAWYGAPTRAYDVDFHDTGGSALDSFMVRATTGPLQTGAVTADWQTLLSGIGADDYTADWTLDSPTWNLLQDGTNYVTVRVYDGSGNMDERVDAFVVFKDTTPPALASTYGSAVWRSTFGFTMHLVMSDPHSRIDTVEGTFRSGPGITGAQLQPWTGLTSGLDMEAAAPDMPMDEATWNLLQSGTNYFSLRAWDYSVPANTGTVPDVFYVLKDTVPPAAVTALTGVALSTYSALASFPAPAEYPSGLAEFALQYANFVVSGGTLPVAGSTHVFVSTSGVSAAAPQYVPMGPLSPNTTYWFNAVSRDQAGNWSAPSNGAAVATLAEAAPWHGTAMYVTSATIGWTPVFSAGYVLEASSSPVFAAVIISSATNLLSVDSLTVTGLTPNMNYSFRWASLNWNGRKNYESVYAWPTYAAVPASGTVYADVSSTSVNIEWLANGNSENTEYVLAASSDEFVTLLSSIAVAPAAGDPFYYTFAGLSPNTTYWFRAQAHGVNGVYTDWLALGSTVTLPVPPNITGYALWRSSVAITWDSNGNGAGTQYQADLSTAVNFTPVEVSSLTENLWLDLGISRPNTTYYLRLRSVSAASGQLSAYAQDSGASRAAAPLTAGVYTVGPNFAGLYWDIQDNPGGPSGNWSGAGALPGARYGHAVALAGDVLLLSGGSDGAGYRADVWAAPLSVTGQLGAWRQVRSLPGARYGHVSAALNGRLYVIGGYDGIAPRAEVWSAPVSSSGALGEWVSEAPLPIALYAHALAVIPDRLYVVGGYNGGARAEIYTSSVSADGRLGAWVTAGSLQEGRYGLGAAIAISSGPSRLYAAGGNDGVAARTEVWAFPVNGDGTLGARETAAPLPLARFAHGFTAAPQALFAAGGNSGTAAKDTVYRAAVNYDGTLGAWETQPALSAAVQSLAFGERAGRLFAFGGYDGASAKAQVWSAPLNGTEYSVDVAGASFSSTPWLAAGNLQLGGLLPDTAYAFSVKARNSAGVETVYGAPVSTRTFAAQPSTAAFGGVYISSAQVNWLAADNPAGTVYDAQLSSDAAHALLASSFSAASVGRLFTGLDADHLYYARVRAVNAVGAPTSWTELGQFRTRSDPSLDFSSPTMSGVPATAWRNAPGALYDMDFADAGGSYLDRFEVAAATYAAASPLTWVQVSSGINSFAYAADWALPAGMFETLAPATNYISVRVFDGNGNSSTTVDAFYILKDTVAPTIGRNQAGENFWRMDAGGAIYDVDFADAVSGLAAIEYSASPNQGSGDAAGLPWTPVAVLSTGPAVYAGNWAVDFAALPNDATNFISVRARDLAGNVQSIDGIDAFKILKYVAGPETGLTAPASAFRSALAAITGTASDARSHALAAVEVSIKESATGKYWDGAGFLGSAITWFVAAGTATWSYAPGAAWLDGASYEVVARSSDTAGNYSLVYATRAFTYDTLAPVISYNAPATGSTVNAAGTLEGSALDVSGISGMALMFRRGTDGLWWDFAAGTWTVSGSSVAIAAGSSWSFAVPELLKASLESGASYYYTVYAEDNSVPMKNIGFGGYTAVFNFLDDQPPAAIADFSASTGNAPGNISLQWTAPGDDGASGMILYGQYRVEYATYAANVFSTAAAQVYGDFTAVSAGSARNRELTGLTPGETYYLRAWTRDDAGNWSALSNGATAQAAPFPDRISGRVTTISSAGVTGVLMEAYDINGVLQASGYTVNDGSGTYVLRGLPSGSYRVQATWEADDIISSVGTDGLVLGRSDADFTLSVNYQLASIGGELAGYRLSALGRRTSAAGAAAGVELYQRGRLIATAPVDAAGKFLFGNLLPGKYVLRVPRTEGGYKELSVRVKAGEALTISPLGDLLKTAKVYVYPNPARRVATFHIESDLSPVTKSVTVFDVTGRAVKEFKDGDFTQSGSVYEAVWNIPAKVASGVYVYAVRVKFEATGEYKKVVKKFAIVK